MVVKPHGYQLKCPNVYLNNNKLEYVEQTKYLGVTFFIDLTDDEDMLRHLHSFYAKSNSIIRKFHKLKLKVAYNNMHRQI